ncbi:Glutamate synthase [NADPH] large chain [Sinorhizobium sojae CCBAU 05684]|uniref:Glutamate synthase [NADPH] large chain n=1 Tax=Sinorhizobium sojae CCBAU 05684 TaxID=716928 RepID=A0A249PCR9_9HYPH|nr:DNA-binding domain-containing protein [Sinorhizobium sojae]ASY63565.1 Glutamate synthase [NADPH] large chain [Sinorhizobium sojae CCBAU 05684]
MRAVNSSSSGPVDGCRYPEGFTPGLLDPSCATPAFVAGPNGKAADRRFNVYRNNVTVSLMNALADIFPATLRITGEAFFRAMARFHVRETPPTSRLLFEYGRDFPNFIARYEYAQSLPWLADVARIERAWLDSYHAADAAALSPAEIVAVPPDRLGDLVFEAHPATRILRSDYPAVTIFSVNRASDPVGRIETTAAESALVTRPGLDVEVRRLAPGVDRFLGGIIAGETLESAAAAAGEGCPEFDLTAAIRTMLEAGAVAAIRQGG